jgi:hypothetical protein
VHKTMDIQSFPAQCSYLSSMSIRRFNIFRSNADNTSGRRASPNTRPPTYTSDDDVEPDVLTISEPSQISATQGGSVAHTYLPSITTSSYSDGVLVQRDSMPRPSGPRYSKMFYNVIIKPIINHKKFTIAYSHRMDQLKP